MTNSIGSDYSRCSYIPQQRRHQPAFGSTTDATTDLIKKLPSCSKAVAKFVKLQESDENLRHIRFIQDTATNWMPKALFSRSTADLAEMSFLEFSESALFYYLPGILGEHVLRKGVFSKFLPENLQKNIANTVQEITENSDIKDEARTKLLNVKAGLVLGCAGIPAAEYALSYAKNLFTLKLFKQADFNNIANLDKNKKEDPAKQKKVKDSAESHLKKAAIFSAVSLVAGIGLAAFGHNFKSAQKVSKAILQPGLTLYSLLEKAGVKAPKLKKFLGTYVNFDFKNDKGKLTLSKGQLAASVIAGVFGYFGAAKDRGKLDFLEVATRLPLVALYTIFGSSALEHGLKKHLYKKGTYKDLITKTADGSYEVAKLNDLHSIAQKLSKQSGKTVEQEWQKLFKGKAIVTSGPFVFSLGVMGFFIAGMSRFWTQYRYNHNVGKVSDKTQFTSANKTQQFINNLRSNKTTSTFSQYKAV